MFKIDVCKVCGVNCFWIEGIDGDLAEKEVCSLECLAQLQSAQQSVQPTLLESPRHSSHSCECGLCKGSHTTLPQSR